jgi:hypothetical protein
MPATKITLPRLIAKGIQKAPVFFLLSTLLATPPLILADQGTAAEPVPPAVVETQGSNPDGERKNDLGGFFTIGAIINILFLGAFLYWARKESQKGKQAKPRQKP